MNREEWLQGAADAVRQEAAKLGFPVPDVLRISVGFPSRGALARKKRRVGECWTPAAAKDGVHQIFISPLVHELDQVLEVVTHEVSHSYNIDAGHKKPFQKIGAALGLTGPWTSTSWKEGLPNWAKRASEKLGPFPHSPIDPILREKTKQSTRMLKVSCPECDYTVRTTAKRIAVGLPTCPCGVVMEACLNDDDEKDESEEEDA